MSAWGGVGFAVLSLVGAMLTLGFLERRWWGATIWSALVTATSLAFTIYWIWAP